jgi:glycosyltransferase involved in cell wall biosynthesis
MITFYGHFSGWQSYPTVCRAIAKYLDSVGVELRLCDLRPEGSYDDVPGIPRVPSDVRQAIQKRARRQQLYEGKKRPGTALVFAFPEWLTVVPRHEKTVGYHVCDLNKLPPHWVPCMNTFADLVLTPSRWCAGVFKSCGVEVPIEVVRHGVDPAFGEAEVRELEDKEPFVVTHFCSALEPARKGTPELLTAWRNLINSGELEKDKHLLRVVSAFSVEHEGRINNIPQTELTPAQEGPPDVQATRYLDTHFVAQPSRAEGFGCIPLEALATGTPVLATSCTGHAEYMGSRLGGEAVVPHGGLAPCGQSEGMAPTVDVATLREVLLYGIGAYGRLRGEALARRPELRESWSWRRVLENLPDLLGG